MNIRELIIEDVRCFAGRQIFNIRPITFIVGENSTGKSTALGCLHTLDRFLLERGLNFNLEPYSMGAFADIVMRSDPVKENFQLGVKYDKNKAPTYYLKLEEKNGGSEPVVKEHIMISEDGSRSLVVKKGTWSEDTTEAQPYGNISVEEDQNGKWTIEADQQLLQNSPSKIFSALDSPKIPDEKRERLSSFIKSNGFNSFNLFLSNHYIDGFAPIRFKPQRTYDPLKGLPDPEGSEMPTVLINIFRSNKSVWKKHLKKPLDNFGQSSGLFTEIELRELGPYRNDPFQLQVKTGGQKVNMIDVGYGISQILPILVRVLLPGGGTFLMQQPEVHLHPKAQAELISFLIGILAEDGHEYQFVMETHSDYMIDRARIEVMRGTINPEDVSLIFLEPEGDSVKVHNICLDGEANLLNVPSGYRDFFYEESNELLGFPRN